MEQRRKRKKSKRTAEEEFKLYQEFLRVPNGKKAEFMRKHGLYPAEVARLEETCRNGAVDALKTRKSRKRDRMVPESELNEREQRVRELEGLIADLAAENKILKKKVNGE
jgi:hypothetical protein